MSWGVRRLVRGFMRADRNDPPAPRADLSDRPAAQPKKPRKHPVQVQRADFLGRFDLKPLRGLEIGPFCRPTLRREDYPGIQYADVMSEAYLRRLARKSPVLNEDDVASLDYVLGKKRLDEVVPHGSLDFVLCCHVMEHFPDMISGLQSIERILRPGGVFLVVFPDRRYTYDIDRPGTTLEQLLDRHARRLIRPDPEMVEEHFRMNREVNAELIWQGADGAVGERKFTAEKARQHAETARGSYVDVHCNVLSDKEFGSVIEALNAAGITRLRIDVLTTTRAPSNEFYAALVKPEDPASS